MAENFISIIKKQGDKTVHKLALDANNHLPLSSLRNLFSTASGIKFHRPGDDAFFCIFTSNVGRVEVFKPLPPDENFGDKLYICIFPKSPKSSEEEEPGYIYMVL